MAEDTEGQAFIREWFKDRPKDRPKGFLIDIGAHAGEKYGSMSWDMIQSGWGGLMVEPLPEAFRELKRLYQDWPQVTCVEAACSDEDGEGLLYPCKGVSTLSPEWAQACDSWWKHVRYGAPIKVRTVRLGRLLDEIMAPDHVDFLQVDTEGHDLRVLKGMDWDRSPDLVCVETLNMLHPERKRANGIWDPDPELVEWLREIGYELILLTPGGNGFWTKE